MVRPHGLSRPRPATPGEGRASAVRAVRAALAGRRLVWVGIRGEDVESLALLPELAASFAMMAPLRGGMVAPQANVTLEALSGERRDHDTHDIDRDTSAAAREFRRRVRRDVGAAPCVVLPHTASRLASALADAPRGAVTLAGLPMERQERFTVKRWVETSLARRGVRGLGWRYLGGADQRVARGLLADGPHVLRLADGSGGVGVVRVSTAEELDAAWARAPDGVVAVAPFLEGAVPVNLSGCVFGDGRVTLHPPSVQLIGIGSCTDRPFGYCGNDFGAVATLGEAVLRGLDSLGRVVGEWLHGEGYLGAFGVDALVAGDAVHFTEVNPRFQGSSPLSAGIAAALGVPDLYLDHLAATLGVPPQGPGPSIPDWARRQPPVAEVVVHNTAGRPVAWDPTAPPLRVPPGVRLGLLPGEVRVDPGATLCRFTRGRSVTRTGFSLDADAERVAAAIRSAFAVERSDSSP